MKVLLVHGIGRQPTGSHLVESVEAIVDLLGESGCGAEVQSASLVGQTGDTPAHALVGVGGTQVWLFAEAHWADTFPAPSYRELLWWGFKVAPITAIVYAAGVASTAWRNRTTLWRPTDPAKGGLAGRLWALLLILSALVQIALIPLLVPLLLGVMLGLLVVAIIPLSKVRSGVLRVQRALTGSLGDSYVFSRLPVRRAAILTAVREDLQWLRDVSPVDAPVVVIAHSQGAAVAYHVLEHEEEPVPLLLTYGSGLERLSLTSRALTSGWQFTGCSLTALLGAGLMAWFTPGLIDSVASQPAAWAVCLATYLSVVGVSLGLQGNASAAKSTLLARPRSLIAACVSLLGTLAVVAWAWILYPDIPMWWMGGLFLISGLIRASSLAAADEHTTPAVVGRWVDLQADADPVASAVPSRDDGGDEGKSRQVVRFTLTGSVVRDHVSYWRQPDVFTWRVVRELDEVSSDGGLTQGLAERGRQASASRALLACVRTAALWVLLGVTAVVFAARWRWFDPDTHTWSDELISTFSDAVAFPALAQRYAGSVVTGAVIVVGFLLSYQLVLVTWRCWNRAHLRRFHRQGGTEWPIPAVTLVVVLTTAAAGTGLGIAAFPAGDVADVASQAMPLLWLGPVYMLWAAFGGLVQTHGDWAMIRRGVVWGLVVSATLWTVAYLALLPVLADAEPVQRLGHFEQRKGVVLIVVLAILIIWLVAALIRRVRRRPVNGAFQVCDTESPCPAPASAATLPIGG